jgi:hypothetical protein
MGERNSFELALQADEFAERVVAFVQPIGIAESRLVVMRRREDCGEERSGVHHARSPFFLQDVGICSCWTPKISCAAADVKQKVPTVGMIASAEARSA